MVPRKSSIHQKSDSPGQSLIPFKYAFHKKCTLKYTANSFVGLNIVAELVTTLMNCRVGCLPVSHWLARHCAIQNLVQKANQLEITSFRTKSAVSASAT